MRVKDSGHVAGEPRLEHQGQSMIRIKKAVPAAKADRIDQYQHKVAAKMAGDVSPNSKFPVRTAQRLPHNHTDAILATSKAPKAEDLDKPCTSANVPGSPTEGSTAAESSLGHNAGQGQKTPTMSGGQFAGESSGGIETRIIKRQQQKLYMEQLQEQIKEKQDRKAVLSNPRGSPYDDDF
jgi:hypothetical protein